MYRIQYLPIALEHLRKLKAHDRAMVLDTVDPLLGHQPAVPTRNRKRLRPNPLAPWELRIGDLRVFYDVESAPEVVAEPAQPLPEGVVVILAVGVKRGHRLWLGDEEFHL